MPAKKFDWLNVIDLNAAVNSAKSEMYGDWLRDPWGWPELDYLRENPAPIEDRLATGRTRFERLSVPKINFGTRPAVVQAPADRVVLHALVNTVSVPVAGDLPPFVAGWRLDRDDPKPGRFVRNQQEWLRFIANRRAAADATDSLLATDITNFFGSVPVDRLAQRVRELAGANRAADALEEVLGTFNALADRAGIPQRSTASSLLANAYLRPIDDLLTRYASENSGAHVLRWMDDIWVFGGGHERLRCLQLDLQDELRNIGLEINLGKTGIREGQDADHFVAESDVERDPPTQNEAASGMPFVSSDDEADLDLQFDKFRVRPELTDRTVVRYICTRIKELGRDDLVPELVEIAVRAPQGADHLSRLFARSGHWRDLGSWWVDLAKAPTGVDRLPWPVAQLGTMFPSDQLVEPVADLLAERLEMSSNPPIELLALAAHRLPKWKEADSRVLLRSVGAASDSPLCRRVAAIALHNLGEERHRVDSILSEFEENRCTREMLSARNGKRVAESADFDLASA